MDLLCPLRKKSSVFLWKEIQFGFVFGSCLVRIKFPTNLTVYWLPDINGSIIPLNPFDTDDNISKQDEISEFEVLLGKFIVILRLLVKAAIYLKDFDDLYQRARESTEKTKATRKSHLNLSLIKIELVKNINEVLQG